MGTPGPRVMGVGVDGCAIIVCVPMDIELDALFGRPGRWASETMGEGEGEGGGECIWSKGAQSSREQRAKVAARCSRRTNVIAGSTNHASSHSDHVSSTKAGVAAAQHTITALHRRLLHSPMGARILF